VIDIPAAWKNKKLTLYLGEIDDNDITYFNGVEVGRTNGWDMKRTYTIPSNLVKEGKAVITVRVLDNTGGGGMYGVDPVIRLAGNSTGEIPLSGDWAYEIGYNATEVTPAPKSWNDPNRPTVLFNAMLRPLIPFAIKGAIWYQGEANDTRAYQYRELLPLMIRDWRKQWDSDFPFYFVQLASFRDRQGQPVESAWAELREAQLQTLHLEKTGMAVTIDIGDAKDIHPKNKQDVGKRLALLARAQLYGQTVACSGPVYDSYEMEGNTIRIYFRNADGGLLTKDQMKLKGFEIAGPDHQFKWATAVIQGNEVVVSCEGIEFPVAVRYGWSDHPDCNLYNQSGLPASPFRTDDWPGVTFGKK
jgi:sialate O-acetylesterase